VDLRRSCSMNAAAARSYRLDPEGTVIEALSTVYWGWRRRLLCKWRMQLRGSANYVHRGVIITLQPLGSTVRVWFVIPLHARLLHQSCCVSSRCRLWRCTHWALGWTSLSAFAHHWSARGPSAASARSNAATCYYLCVLALTDAGIATPPQSSYAGSPTVWHSSQWVLVFILLQIEFMRYVCGPSGQPADARVFTVI
jgi:hypothetical protein